MLLYPNIHLTPRENEILNILLNRGPSNKQIAKTLNLSVSMVKLHMGNLLRKFGASNRAQLIVFAMNYQN